MESSCHDFQEVKAQDKQELQERVRTADQQLSDLVSSLSRKGYDQAASYIAYAQKRLFNYVDFWMQTGIASPRTTSYLERLMRELGRRLKKIAFGWSDGGAAKMAQILIRRICSPEQWAEYWKAKLRLTGTVLVSLYSSGELKSLIPNPPILGHYQNFQLAISICFCRGRGHTR